MLGIAPSLKILSSLSYQPAIIGGDLVSLGLLIGGMSYPICNQGPRFQFGGISYPSLNQFILFSLYFNPLSQLCLQVFVWRVAGIFYAFLILAYSSIIFGIKA